MKVKVKRISKESKYLMFIKSSIVNYLYFQLNHTERPRSNLRTFKRPTHSEMFRDSSNVCRTESVDLYRLQYVAM